MPTTRAPRCANGEKRAAETGETCWDAAWRTVADRNVESADGLELFSAIGHTIQNTSSIFQGRFKQFPDYGKAQRALAHQRLERMDRELNRHQFVAGDRFTIADITALMPLAPPFRTSWQRLYANSCVHVAHHPGHFSPRKPDCETRTEEMSSQNIALNARSNFQDSGRIVGGA